MKLLKKILFPVFVMWCLAVGMHNMPSTSKTTGNSELVSSVTVSATSNQKTKGVLDSAKQLLISLGELVLGFLQLAVRFLQLIMEMLRQVLTALGK